MSAVEASPISIDTAPRKEYLRYEKNLGLQAHLISGYHFLHPAKPFETRIQKRHIESFEDRDYNPFNETSKHDRNTHWDKWWDEQGTVWKTNEMTMQEKQDKFNAEYDAWKQGAVAVFNDNNNQFIIDKLGPILDRIGIPIDPTIGFTPEQAETLFERYFNAKPKNKKDIVGVKKFVQDVKDLYRESFDSKRFEEDLDAIKWLATMFGEPSAQIDTNLLDAEYQLETNPDEYVASLNNVRREALDPVAHADLSHVWEHGFPINNENLPMREKKNWEAIKEKIQKHDRMLLIGETGSGKTTQLPQIVYEMMEEGDRMLITQPTQINTRNLSERLAYELRVMYGEVVTFQHGDDRNTKKDISNEKIRVETERLLLIELQNDPYLQKFSHVMVDEVHAQTEDTELIIAALQKANELRAGRKPPLRPIKVILATATANKQLMQDKLSIPNDAIHEVEGRMFDVKQEFQATEITPDVLHSAAANQVFNILEANHTDQGHIMVFTAGKPEIERTIQELQNNPEFMAKYGKYDIIELHAESTEEEKQIAREVNKGRKPPVIFIATNYAATGITIDGLTDVVLTGKKKEPRYDPETGFNYLELVDLTQDEIKQMFGRAGRTNPGRAYHLYTEENYKARREHPLPEMARSDVVEAFLIAKKLAFGDMRNVNLLSTPNPAILQDAIKKLQSFGALDQHENLTPLGERMLRLPVDYHLARAIIEAETNNCGTEMKVIAALVEAKSLFLKKPRDPDQQKAFRDSIKDRDGDFFTLYNMWRAYLSAPNPDVWASENGLSDKAIRNVKKKLEKLLDSPATTLPELTDDLKKKLGISLWYGYADRTMKWSDEKSAYVLPRNKGNNLTFQIDKSPRNPSSVEGNPDIIISAGNSDIDRRGRNLYTPMVKLRNCLAVKQEWLRAA